MKTEDQELVAVARGAAAVLCALHEIGKKDHSTDPADLAKHIVDHEDNVAALLRFAFRKIAEDENLLLESS